MSLPNILSTLDMAWNALPFVTWRSPTLGDTATLDVGHDGLPFYGQQSDALVAGENVILIVISDSQIHPVQRRYPNKRIEAVKETQTKHVEPKFGHQYSEYIP